jgi:AcrR family transcriptional regulator
MSQRNGEITKAELVEKAGKLFQEQGYDQTTINDIIWSVGVSKGAFYHHFASKDEILEEITKEYIKVLISKVGAIANKSGLNALEKLNKIIVVVSAGKFQDKNISSILKKSLSTLDNARAIIKLQEMVIENTYGHYEKIIRQGIDEGLLDVAEPEITARLYLRFMYSIKVEMHHCLEEGVLKEKFDYFSDIHKRILGIKHGSIDVRPYLMGDTNE